MALVAKIPKGVSECEGQNWKYEKAHIALFVPYTLKHTVGDCANSLRLTVVGLKQPTRA